MSQSLLTFLFLLPVLIESKGHWSYGNISLWSHDNHYCKGNLQSPIDLQFNISHYDRYLKQLYFVKQYSEDRPQLVNNGHTAQLNLNNHYVLKHVASQSKDYIVEQIHFHWGHSNNSTNGSEHLLKNRSYPLEMHIVTYSSWFSNISEAMSNTRGLAVVGVFFELSNEPNQFLRPIIDALAHIRHKGEQKSLDEDFELTALLDGNRMRRYYRYDGSLTTPPCYESVIWSVLQEPLKISFNQLDTFRALHEEHNKLMKDTYRSIQSMGTRKLFRSFYSENIKNEPTERISTSGSYGQYLSIHIKLFFILTSSVMIIN